MNFYQKINDNISYRFEINIYWTNLFYVFNQKLIKKKRYRRGCQGTRDASQNLQKLDKVKIF